MESQRLTGLNKRRQITMAGKMMFIWVAIAAVITSFAIVGVQFLFQQWSFNNKVISAKYLASSTLDKNLKNVSLLKQNINELVGSTDLATSRNADSENNLQVILDALPTQSDVTGLATSLQKVIAPQSGVSLESVSVPSDASAIDLATTSTLVGGPIEQPYTVVVSGSYQSIQIFLQNLEKTIRPMNVTGLNVSGSDTSLRATIDFTAYYQPNKVVTITKKAIQ